MKTKTIWVVFFFYNMVMQTIAQTTIILQPDSTQGKDAVVWNNKENTNYGNIESNTAYTWTNSGKLGIKRAFVEFNLSAIPPNATITSAHLSLYYNPTDHIEGFDFHTGNNDIYIQRVDSSWDETTITWNNQPSVSTANQISLPPSSSQTQDYTNIDVTLMVQDMLSLGNHGFIIKMVDEVNYYKSVLFASSEHPVNSLHPEIEVCWTVDNGLSIDPLRKNNIDFKVYPNPSNGTFELELPQKTGVNYEIELFDALGRKIQQYDKVYNKITLHQKGIFIIRVSDSKGSYTSKKIIIN